MASVFLWSVLLLFSKARAEFWLRASKGEGGGGGYDMAQGYHPHNIRKPAVTSFFEHQRKKIGSVAD